MHGIADFDDKQVVVHDFHTVLTALADTRIVRIKRVRSAFRNDDQVVGAADSRILGTEVVLQNSDDPEILISHSKGLADEVGFAQVEQSPLGRVADDAYHLLAVRIGLCQPAPFADDGAGFRKKCGRGADQFGVHPDQPFADILAGIADRGDEFDVVHLIDVFEVGLGQSENFDPADVRRPLAGTGDRRLLGMQNNLVDSHRFDLRQRLQARAFRNSQHGDDAADPENNPERRQQRTHFMQQQIVERKPEQIAYQHGVTSLFPRNGRPY